MSERINPGAFHSTRKVAESFFMCGYEFLLSHIRIGHTTLMRKFLSIAECNDSARGKITLDFKLFGFN